MFNPSYTFYRLYDYLVITNGKKTYMAENGYKLLRDLRDRILETSLDRALDHYQSMEHGAAMKHFIHFLIEIGFIESHTESPANTEAVNNRPVNNDLFQSLAKEHKHSTQPDHLQIDVESLCNFDCVHCVRGGSRTYNPNLRLSLDQFENLFSDFESMGGKYVTFTGGEPFLRADFPEILKLTTKYGFGIVIMSNGSMINEDTIALLKPIRLAKIQITLYGNREDYPRMTRGGDHEKTINALKLLKRSGFKYSVPCPLTRENTGSFAYFKEMQSEHPLTFYHIIDDPLHPNGRSYYSEFSLEPLSEQLSPFIKPIEASYQYTKDRPKACIIGSNLIFVGITGEVYPCYQYPVPIGNLHHRRITEIWNKNDELDYIRTVNSGHVFDICVTCGSSEYCVRCLAYNMIYNGSLVSLYEGTCLKADRAREEQLHYQAGGI